MSSLVFFIDDSGMFVASEWLRARALQALAGRDGGLCHSLPFDKMDLCNDCFVQCFFICARHAVRLCELVSHCRGFCTW